MDLGKQCMSQVAKCFRAIKTGQSIQIFLSKEAPIAEANMCVLGTIFKCNQFFTDNRNFSLGFFLLLSSEEERSFSIAKLRKSAHLCAHDINQCFLTAQTVFVVSNRRKHNAKIFLAKYHAHFISLHFVFDFSFCFVSFCYLLQLKHRRMPIH